VRKSNCSSKQFTKYILNFYFRKIRRGPDLPKRNYCVSRGVSVVGKDTKVAVDQLGRCREKNPGRTEDNHKERVGVVRTPAETRKQHHQNIGQKRYRARSLKQGFAIPVIFFLGKKYDAIRRT